MPSRPHARKSPRWGGEADPGPRRVNADDETAYVKGGNFQVELLHAGQGHGLEGGNSCSMARMKKAKSGKRIFAAKGRSAPKNVDEYLAGVPEPARNTLNKIRAAIRSAVPPEATEIISYRI